MVIIIRSHASLRRRHAVLLVPARLPVLLLALDAAVEGDLAAAAGAVRRRRALRNAALGAGAIGC